MKLYIVTTMDDFGDGMEHRVSGVFKTKEEARELMEEILQEYQENDEVDIAEREYGTTINGDEYVEVGDIEANYYVQVKITEKEI